MEQKCKNCCVEPANDLYGLCHHCYEDEANICAMFDGQISKKTYLAMHKNIESIAKHEIPSKVIKS